MISLKINKSSNILSLFNFEADISIFICGNVNKIDLNLQVKRKPNITDYFF